MNIIDLRLDKYIKGLTEIETLRVYGRVKRLVGVTIESEGPGGSVGELCYIRKKDGDLIPTEIVGFRDGMVLLMPLGEMSGISTRALVESTGRPLRIRVGDCLLGRVLDGLGEPIDGKGEIKNYETELSIYNSPPNPMDRNRILQPLGVGVKSIDSAITCGKGQRVGLFAGSGVGKSTLLGMIARNSEADVNVISLVGERGRELREFLEKDLGPEGIKRSVTVVATSDKSPLVRIKGALVGTTIAEYFRDKGLNVMLLMDSITRFAMSQREVGLASGEPPTTKGYPPSVFALLPKLLERTGTSTKGTITAIYTVLVDGDDMNEPVADAVRSILDGHIVLSRKLAHQNHYPAVDVLESISRVMISVVSEKHLKAAGELRNTIATYRDAKDLIEIGAYKHGTNPKVDYAIKMNEPIMNFLKQSIEDRPVYANTISELVELLGVK
jgi:flagellum-specific ATP synthase